MPGFCRSHEVVSVCWKRIESRGSAGALALLGGREDAVDAAGETAAAAATSSDDEGGGETADAAASVSSAAGTAVPASKAAVSSTAASGPLRGHKDEAPVSGSGSGSGGAGGASALEVSDTSTGRILRIEPPTLPGPLADVAPPPRAALGRGEFRGVPTPDADAARCSDAPPAEVGADCSRPGAGGNAAGSCSLMLRVSRTGEAGGREVTAEGEAAPVSSTAARPNPGPVPVEAPDAASLLPFPAAAEVDGIASSSEGRRRLAASPRPAST